MTDSEGNTVEQPWVDIVPGQMNQTHQLMGCIAPLLTYLEGYDSRSLHTLLSMNQNPYCEGDGSMSVEQWNAAADVNDMVNDLREACRAFMNAPLGPAVREGPRHIARASKVIANVFADDDIPF